MLNTTASQKSALAEHKLVSRQKFSFDRAEVLSKTASRYSWKFHDIIELKSTQAIFIMRYYNWGNEKDVIVKKRIEYRLRHRN